MSSSHYGKFDQGNYERLPSFPASRNESPTPSGRFSTEDTPENPPWGWDGEDREPGEPESGVPDVEVVAPTEGEHSPASSLRSQGYHRKRHKPSSSKGTTQNTNRESRARRSTWLCIDMHGQRTSLHSDKRGIIQRFKLGVPIRDMRLMDPNLLTSETGKILVRDNAIVFSVEHVRVIITAEMIIIPRDGFDKNSANVRFISQLQSHIEEAAQEEQARHFAAQKALEMRVSEGMELATDLDDIQSSDSSGYRHEVAPLPFELRVLENCIDDICSLCSGLTKELESFANPSLDALTHAVTTKNLERVRKVKGRHQRLLMRVRAFREELQRFLEDDDDMIKLCLTRKRDLERALAASGAQAGERAYSGHTPFSTSAPIPIRRSSLSAHGAGSMHHYHSGISAGGGKSPPGRPSLERAESDPYSPPTEDESESVEIVENLLESYFMQVDSAYDRLCNIGEYVQDTEEFVNIELDSSRNRLIRLEIVLTAGTFALAIFSLVGGILGENLKLPDSITQTILEFVYVNIGTLVFCLIVFASILLYIRLKRLL